MRRNVYLPDELDARLAALPELNVSAVVQRSLWDVVGCHHPAFECSTCRRALDRSELVDELVGRYYGDLLWELTPLVDAGATAEGAARIAKRVARDHGVRQADRLPLPRPARRAA